MKAEKIRIGNFVNLKNWQDEISFFGEFDISQNELDKLVKTGDGNAKVLSITSEEVELLAYGCDLYYYSYAEILPIKITEKWLIDLGFNKFPGSGQLFDTDDFWAGRLINDGFFEISHLELTLKYVHDLQNVFFALTGRELELKNECSTCA